MAAVPSEAKNKGPHAGKEDGRNCGNEDNNFNRNEEPMVVASQAIVSAPDSRGVAAKAAKGAVALGGRQFVVHGLNIAGSIALARLLSPSDFGVYAIVMFLIQFLGSFGGTGLACNLIRTPNEPAEDDYRAVFTFQQLALSILVGALWIASPYIVEMYHLQSHYVWLFRMTAASLFITSFMVIPQVKLEREINFAKLAVVEIWQAVVFNVIAVSLAWLGWRGMSFSVALVARSATGVLAVYVAEPWTPHWHLNWRQAKPHLAFGFFYQSSQVVSLIKDAISPILIGVMVSTAAVGYISWAAMLAGYPVLMLMVLNRLYVPAFSRLQHDRMQLALFVKKVILAANALAAPVAVLTLVLIHPITNLVFGSKWGSAIPMFVVFWLANLLSPSSIPVLGLLNALGKSRLCFGFTVMWAALNWALGVPLVLWLGPIGLAWAALGVQLSYLGVVVVAKRELNFEILLPSLYPWLGAAAVGAGIFALESFHPANSVLGLATCFVAGLAAYTVGMTAKYGKQLTSLLRYRAA
jgi:O-antigen/teichoic acid export membrane protein